MDNKKIRRKDMNDDLGNKTDDEPKKIVSRAENTNIPGSLFQRAKIDEIIEKAIT